MPGAPVIVTPEQQNGTASIVSPDVQALLDLEIPLPDADGLLDTEWARAVTWSLMVEQAKSRAYLATIERKDAQIADLKAALRAAKG